MALQIKINLPNNSTKTFKFPPEMLISEVIKEIQTKTELGGADHGLYQRAAKGKKARWLQPNRTLRFYDITSNSELDYKKKTRPLQIYLADNTLKKILIDDSSLVRDIVKVIVEHLSIHTAPEIWGLRKQDSAESQFLQSSQTLQEQDVNENDTLLFEKMLYDSQENLEDPMVLHLTYCQDKNRVIQGRYPCQRSEAILLAALQAAATFGSHDPTKHKPGFLNLEEFLPPQWRKSKNIEADIWKEHKKLVGMSEQHAKLRYLQSVRSLKWYGVTFFVVQEKPKVGGKKLQKFLLGITRDKIIKADPKTTEIIKEWPFKQMKRWAASAHQFTLDFGDYEDDYFVVLTEESNQIARLIVEYIDLSLRATKSIGGSQSDDQDVYTGTEESIPTVGGVATIGTVSTIEANPTTVGGYISGQPITPGQQLSYNAGMQPKSIKITDPQQKGVAVMQSAFPETQRVTVFDLPSAMKAITFLSDEMSSGVENWRYQGQLTISDWTRQLQTNQDALLSHVEHLVQQAKLNPSSIVKKELDTTAKTIFSELFGLASAAKNIASLDSDQIPVLHGAKAVAESISKLLTTVDHISSTPNDPKLQAALLEAEKLLQTSLHFLNGAKEGELTDKGAQILMSECVDELSHAMDETFEIITESAASLDAQKQTILNEELEQKKKVKEWHLAEIEHLIHVALKPDIKKQLLTTTQALVNVNVKLAENAKKIGIPSTHFHALDTSVKKVENALQRFVASTETIEERASSDGEIDLHGGANNLISTLSQISGNINDPPKLVSLVKGAIVASNNLMTIIEKLVGGAVSEDIASRLKKRATAMNQETHRLLDSAKKVNANPGDLPSQKQLLNACLRLENLTHELLADAGETASLVRLRYCSKAATAAMLKLVKTASGVLNNIKNEKIKKELVKMVPEMLKTIDELLTHISAAGKMPQNKSTQTELLLNAQRCLPMFSEMVLRVRQAYNHIDDPNKKQELNLSATHAFDQNKKLDSACTAVADLGGQLEIEEAMADFDAIDADLENADFSAKQGSLQSLGQTRDNALTLLNVATKTLSVTMESLASTAMKGGKIAKHIKDSASASGQVVLAVRSMAGTTTDRTTQKRIIDAAKTLVSDVLHLINAARSLTIDHENEEKRLELEKNQKKMRSALATLLVTAKGIDARECDEALQILATEVNKLSASEATNTTFKQASEGLVSACKALTAVVTQLVAIAKSDPRGVGPCAKIGATTMSQLIQAANIAASSAFDKTTSMELLKTCRNLVDALSNLINAAKEVTAKEESAQQDAVENLDKVMNEVTNSIQSVLNALGGQTTSECEEAVRSILDAITVLDQGNLEDVHSMDRSEILEEFRVNAKLLGQIVTRLVSTMRTAPSKLGLYAKQAASTIQNLIIVSRSAAKQPINTESPKSKENLSEDAVIILKCCKLITTDPHDTAKVVAASKKAALHMSKLTQLAKESSKNIPVEEKAKTQQLVKAVKAAIESVKQLSTAAQNSLKKSPETTEALINAAKDLTEKTLKVDKCLDEESEETSLREGVDPQTAKQLTNATKTVAMSTSELIRSSVSAITSQQSAKQTEQHSRSIQAVTEAIQGLMAVLSTLNPGVQECQKAIEILHGAIGELDSAAIALTIGQLQAKLPQNKTPQQIQNDLLDVMKELAEDLRTLQAGVLGSSSGMVEGAKQLQTKIPIIVKIAKAVVCSDPNQQRQQNILTLNKQVIEGVLNVVQMCMEAANSLTQENIEKLQKATTEASQTIAQLLNTLQSKTTLSNEISQCIDLVSKLSPTLDEPLTDFAGNYQHFRSEFLVVAKEVASAALGISTVDKTNTGQVGLAVTHFVETFPRVVEIIRGAIATTTSKEAAHEMTATTKNLLETAVAILRSVKVLSEDPHNVKEQNSLRSLFNKVNTTLSELLNQVKKGAVGETMIEQAIKDITKATNNLNATSLYAQAGQLEKAKETGQRTIGQIQSDIVLSVNTLLTNCKSINEAIKGTEEQLGEFATKIAQHVNELTTIVISSVSRLPDNISQQDLLNGAKALAIACHQLLLAGKAVQNAPNNSAAQTTFVESQNALSEAANQLIVLTKAVSDEFTRLEVELDNAKKFIELILQHPTGTVGAKPEDVVTALRQMTDAMANLVLATNQEDVITGAKNAAQSTERMINTAYGSAKLTNDENIRRAIVTTVKEAATRMLNLLDIAKLDRSKETTQPKLEEASGQVAVAIAEVVKALRALPNAQNLSLDETMNLESLAEAELRNCAKTIEEAAKTLLQAKPKRSKPKQIGVIDEEDITEAILDAARAITTATGHLIEAATNAQHERQKRMQQSSLSGTKYHNDPTWANGLISASKAVAGGVKMLVTAANNAVQHKAEQEALVAAARTVASATAHLVTASRVKADPFSTTQQNLNSAAKAVANATNELVKAAQQAGKFEEENLEEIDPLKLDSLTAYQAMEFAQQERIYALQKQLRLAQEGLSQIRKRRYQKIESQQKPSENSQVKWNIVQK